MSLSAEATIGSLVSERLGRARVFHGHQIDFCCGGGQSLAEACRRKGLEPAKILAELVEADRAAASEELDLGGMSLLQLTTHLTTTHHAYLRRELPRLTALADKVAQVHGERHPELVELRAVVHHFSADMLVHLDKEELILFPLCARIGQGDPADAQGNRFVIHPVGAMEQDHLVAGRDLERMRELSGGFRVPEDACTSYRVLFEGLAELESDTHLHIHKENNLLFPQAIAQAGC